MGKLFGTDGIRGIVGEELTPELAEKAGRAVAYVLKNELGLDKIVLILGTDTRRTRIMIAQAVSKGVTSLGGIILNADEVPTPAVAYFITSNKCHGGFVISASHNPSEYNGIKVLDNNGIKLTEELENKIEDAILNMDLPSVDAEDRGEYHDISDLLGDYCNYLVSTVPKDTDFSKLKILVDTANGSASVSAGMLFSKLNANCDFINNKPNGTNINANCGSTHIEGLQEKVVSGGYDIGIAYDGDADRCILVDEKGNVLDGDYLVAILANDLKKEGKLTNNTVVGTVMSNLGLKEFCKNNDINFVETNVGDKYIIDAMNKSNYVIGGEQSGHVIQKEFANTGDGELISLQILNIMVKENKKLSELASIMRKFPQVLINIKVKKSAKDSFDSREDIKAVIKSYEEKLNGNGRVNVRPSGTENIIRVMFEGENEEEINKLCQELAGYIDRELNNNLTLNKNML